MRKQKYVIPTANTLRTKLRTSLLAASSGNNIPLSEAQIKAGVAKDSPSVTNTPTTSFD